MEHKNTPTERMERPRKAMNRRTEMMVEVAPSSAAAGMTFWAFSNIASEEGTASLGAAAAVLSGFREIPKDGFRSSDGAFDLEKGEKAAAGMTRRAGRRGLAATTRGREAKGGGG